LREAESGADIVIIDGSGGLYDGAVPGDEFGSDADIARLTHTPVLLVTDTPRYSNSMAALVQGFVEFSQGVVVGGVLANRIPLAEEVGPILSHPDVQKMNGCMLAYGLPRVVGGIPSALFATPIPS
jgi:cobyrinic acid a,c-diamide synthase